MSDRSRFILIGTAIGAAIGLAAALVAAEATEERQNLLLANSDGKQNLSPPSTRDWVKFGVAAVTLLRQFADMLTPK